MVMTIDFGFDLDQHQLTPSILSTNAVICGQYMTKRQCEHLSYIQEDTKETLLSRQAHCMEEKGYRI